MPDREPQRNATDELVERAKAGDEAAFAAVYDDLAPKLFRFFRYRGTPPETAEDLTQRVFLKMIEQLPKYESRGAPFEAWIYRVARNAWIDEGRRKRPSVPLEVLVEKPSGDDDPELAAFASVERDQLQNALAALPGEQREVIACRFFAGLSPRETAAQMGRSEGAVRALQHRAMGGLRRRLQQLERAPGTGRRVVQR
jgi:RNA polymerase sigma-70 factor, ECF subfamily